MKDQTGFTLVELAIVILIMGLILGAVALPLSVQLENRKIRETRELLDDIGAALNGFAIANGHLPCPATPSSSGFAAVLGGGCAAQHGFVPASTLSLTGPRNDDNLLLDAWASPLRYSVSAADADGDGSWDFVFPGEMRDVTAPQLAPDLVVCSVAAGASPTACASSSATLSNVAPSVIYSLGKDWSDFASADQLANVGATVGGGPSGAAYRIAADGVFVDRRFSSQAGNEFDDIVVWSSPGQLYRDLLHAGQLP